MMTVDLHPPAWIHEHSTEDPEHNRSKQGAVVMGRIGIPELVIILFIVILIFGASRLPEIGRGIGKGIRNFKDASSRDSDQKAD
jgi:sec-independent protein translocase protein TatA